MADSVNMSLDEIIRQNRASRSRGRGGGTARGRGVVRGGPGRGRGGVGGRGRGGGGRGGSGGRGNRGGSRANTPGRQGRSRSRGQSQNRSRSQSRARSRSRQRRSTSRARSASRSRSQLRSLTPRGRAGLEDQRDMPSLVTNNRFRGRGGMQNRLRRSNSNPNFQSNGFQGNIHSRLGMTTRRGTANLRRPLAVAKRGISKRGRGLITGNRYSNVGLRSDQILQQQQQNWILQKNMIRSQTFTRSRNNSFSSPSQLTVSVANDFAKRRRNSVGSGGYLNKQSLAQLNNNFGGYNTRRGPGSVKSMGSNRSNRSNRSGNSNYSNNSKRSMRSRGWGRGRGRGGNRGVGGKFVNKQVLNTKLQKEIAAIQGKAYGNESPSEAPGGVNFTPTPAATAQTLHQRFASI